MQELDNRIKKRKQSILIELPELLNKLILLIDAGESIQQAIARCVKHKPPLQSDKALNPLTHELRQMLNELNNNRSFHLAMEDFNQRCHIQEVSIFTTTVLLNYKRGGEQLALALRELSRIVWEKRAAIAKTLGEEASSKLVFPMILIFIIVMIIIASPAIMLMYQN
jgi:tight adherence protein C